MFKKNSESQLKKALENIKLVRGAVPYLGEKVNETVSVQPTPKPQPKPRVGQNGGMKKATIDDAIGDIKDRFDISDEDAIVIREVFETVIATSSNKETVIKNKENKHYIEQNARPNIYKEVYGVYENKLNDDIYIGTGGIMDLISVAVIEDFIKAA